MMKKIWIGVAVFSLSTHAAEVGPWIDAAKEMAIPDYSSIVNHDTQAAVIDKNAIGDTDDLSQLKGEDGMGDITTPGLEEATRCLADAKDPKCLAVQLVYEGAANPPSLTETEKDQLLNDYQTVIGNAGDIAGEASDWVSTDIVCETVTTVIPGREELEICEVGEVPQTGTCEAGWEMVTATRYLYRCHILETSRPSCSIHREAVTHNESIYQCVHSPEERVDEVCAVPAEVSVTKIYPYSCRVSTGEEFTQTCVKTLRVTVIPGCSVPLERTLSLTKFASVGFDATGSAGTLRVRVPCSDTFSAITLMIGSRALGRFTAVPQTVSATYRIGWTFSIRALDEANYEIIVSNKDTGLGVVTDTLTVPVNRKSAQTIDTWEQTCQTSSQ